MRPDGRNARVDDSHRRHGQRSEGICGISVYGRNTNHNEAEEIEQTIRGKLLSTPHVIQMHGFYLNEEKKQIQFDVVVDFDASNRRQIFDDAIAGIRAMYPDYTIQAILDPDTSD